MRNSQAQEEEEAVCTFPLFSTLVLGVFSCIYNFCFLWQGWRLVALVINKRLRTRVCGLVLALGMLLPAHVFFMGISVLSTPGNPVFESMAFLGFLSVFLCISVGEWILVVQPIADALAVRSVYRSLPKSAQFAVTLCVLAPEEDNNQYPTQESLLLKATDSLDVGISRENGMEAGSKGNIE